MLYISHNGILEGLGRSQALAYLLGLARRGAEIDLLSFELPDANAADIARLRRELPECGICWHPLERKRDRRLRVKLAEAMTGVFDALRTSVMRRPDIVHGRGYIPTAIADALSLFVPRSKLLFDCRGMLGDEYVESGHWSRDQLEYKLIKRYEQRAFHADGVVVLTRALERWARERDWFGRRTVVEAIPCCVDLDEFRFLAAERTRIRRELRVEDAMMLVYAGSLGSWYREEDIARFAGITKRRASGRVVCLILSRSDSAPLTALLERHGLDASEVHVRSVRPAEMSSWLSAADIGLSFIASRFSKLGSSPTKVAEYLACGLPVVLNGDIGDQDELTEETESCVVVDGSFSEEALVAASDRALLLAGRPIAARVAEGRRVAEARFGLETVGVPRYERLYRALVR